MLDWQGLLKFSLKYSDGTNPSNFKQMSKQDKQFLQAALNQYCNAEVKRIGQILKSLSEPQLQDSQEQRLALLQQLQQLLDSLDRGSTLYNINGHITILKIIFFSKFESNRIIALQIFSSANQNDASIQTHSINSGAMQLVQVLQKQQKENKMSEKLKLNIFSAISSMIRGENLQAKRIFIHLNGLQLLKRLHESSPSQRFLNKIYNLWRDLLYYDNSLNQTYHDLSSFSNTAGLKIAADKHELTYDVNQEMKQKNYLPENQKFKGCIAQFLKKNQIIKGDYEKWLKKQEEQH